MEQKNPLKKIIIIGVVVFLLIVGVSLYFIINNMINSSSIELLVAPQSSEIVIDGKKYTNGTYAINPGNHTITISKEGFGTKETTFATKKDETTKVYIYLIELEGGDWYATHEEDRMILGVITSSLTEQDINKLYDENASIVSELPIRVDYYSNNYSKHTKYTISYKIAQDNSKVSLTIVDYTGGNLETALDNLKSRGINPDEYEIEYTDKSEDTGSGHAF